MIRRVPASILYGVHTSLVSICQFGRVPVLASGFKIVGRGHDEAVIFWAVRAGKVLAELQRRGWTVVDARRSGGALAVPGGGHQPLPQPLEALGETRYPDRAGDVPAGAGERSLHRGPRLPGTRHQERRGQSGTSLRPALPATD
ncbi:hypothetical protein [Plantactinospora sp. ZYX-F-223]|uniref:hypothetical protein n=1 Tax=Plantactinospora sp. ZYX-F-223 TaxID=3144103 RepID=UPI0031FD80C4